MGIVLIRGLSPARDKINENYFELNVFRDLHYISKTHGVHRFGPFSTLISTSLYNLKG